MLVKEAEKFVIEETEMEKVVNVPVVNDLVEEKVDVPIVEAESGIVKTVTSLKSASTALTTSSPVKKSKRKVFSAQDILQQAITSGSPSKLIQSVSSVSIVPFEASFSSDHQEYLDIDISENLSLV